jgi:hypothetical protein
LQHDECYFGPYPDSSRNTSLLIVACRCCLLLLAAAAAGAGVGVLFSPSLLGRLESVTPQWLMLLLRRR